MRQKTTPQTFNEKAMSEATDPPTPATYPVVEFDPAEFLHFLDGVDWSDAEKREYITLVRNIVREFVALGFGVHPMQQAQKACGELSETPRNPGPSAPSMIDSSHHDLIKNYMRLNGPEPGSGAGGVENE